MEVRSFPFCDCEKGLRVECISAFVGMGVMVLTLPVPGYVAKIAQDVQTARMKKTDARVQTVTESKPLPDHPSM